MAQTLTVASGDTISKILTRRGVKPHAMFDWLAKVRRTNPHMGDLDRIWPGDRLLIPDSLIEVVPEYQVWQNALAGIPQGLKRPHTGNTALYFTTAGDTIEGVAQTAFANQKHRLPPSAKRAVLLNNNPILVSYLGPKYLPAGLTLNVTPVMLSGRETHFWQAEAPLFGNWLQQFDPSARQLYQDIGPRETLTLAQIIESLRAAGSAVGLDYPVTAASYGLGGVSGYAASGQMALESINALSRELYNDAVKKLGTKVVVSNKAHHIRQMMAFLKSHPKFPTLMAGMKRLPTHLVSVPARKITSMSPSVTPQIARQFRRQYWLALSDWPSSRYMGTIAGQLNGRVSLLKTAGRAATWYVPAALGLYTAANAPPEMRMRTLFEEGFGVVGGFAGTLFGANMVGLGIVAVLGLGPFGAFLAVFVCASAFGLAGSELSKWGGGKIFDVSNIVGERIYGSFDEFVGALQ